MSELLANLIGVISAVMWFSFGFLIVWFGYTVYLAVTGGPNE